MRVPYALIGLLLAGAVAAGCATRAEPLTQAEAPALNAPEPPPRVVVPATVERTLPPVVDEPPDSTVPTTPARTPPRNPNPRPATTPPPEPPPAATAPPPPFLLTSANSPGFEKAVRRQLDIALGHLNSLNPKSLGPDAKAHYDAARGFVRQAEDALKVKNLVYAGQLADKAATMAALLRK
jgi:hypothetical protein